MRLLCWYVVHYSSYCKVTCHLCINHFKMFQTILQNVKKLKYNKTFLGPDLMFLLKWQKPFFVGLIKLVWPVTLLGGLNRSVTCQMLAVRWTQATKSYLLSSQAFHFKCLSPPDLIVALWTMAQSKYAICKKLLDKNDNLFRALIIIN